MTSDRDPQVAALLDAIEADPPRAGFWEELEARLHDEPAPALELTRIPGHGDRRGRRSLGIALAAAAAALVLVVGYVLSDRPAHETVPVGPGPTATTATTATTAPPSTPTTDGTLLATATVDAWLGTLAQHDAAAGWALLGAQSRESLGTQAAYAAGLDDLEVAWGAYVEPGSRDATSVPLGPTGTWLVVLHPESGAADVRGVLVRFGPGGVGSVEPFVPGPALDLIQVADASTSEGALGAGDVVPLHLDAGATVAVALDGAAVPDGELLRGTDGTVTGVRLPADAAPGLHSVAVAEQLEGGALAADARAVRVA